MVIISEIPDESNDGDPSKKPQEPPNPSQEQPQLPNELIELCVARVSRCDLPVISLASKTFRRLIRLPEFELTRSKLSITERILYALIGFPPREFPSFYILYRQNLSLRLRRVESLPPMHFGSAVVTIGPEIYLIGGCDADGQRDTTDVFLIDCRTHTRRSLPSMKVPRCHAAAGVIDGRIYVIGGCKMRSLNWVELFVLKEQTWIGMKRKKKIDVDIIDRQFHFVAYAVMEKRIYALDRECSCGKASSCVVDDRLYTIDPFRNLGHPIVVYDPKDGKWRPVRGVNGLPCNVYGYAYESKMANLGGKLVILVNNQSQWWDYNGEKQIWCVEIALETRQGGEIWGKLESVDLVLTTIKSPPLIELCQTVTV
ncbi:hypothetical protein EUTSA_v10012053mg [Eutrema salsugineum]|uniref:F-box domain-containing protein n=1 Tax=Eutrema salsugineum TaxID=72664 RepID=V4MGD3_EUTSA|nr:putative F-box/kelch-repeat protein At2g29810 [Eutrema salsugineum]ESQ30391.1 hypothetical protein EUTSA_v10012053mg [Eutrema salsugineum]